MKILASVAAALLALSPVAAAAQFEGVLEYRMTTQMEEGKTIPGTWRMWIGSGGWRSEMSADMRALAGSAPQHPGAMPGTWKMATVGRLAEPGVSYLLNDEKKVYAVIRAEGGDAPAPAEAWTVETKGKDTVAGFGCDRVLLRNPAERSEVDGCFARDITPSRDWLQAMRRGAGRGDSWMDALWKSGVRGFPVRMTFRHGERTVPHTMELVKASRQAVPESTFRVPAGYQEVALMRVMTSPEQDQQISEQMKQMQQQLEQLPPEQRKQVEEMMKQLGQPPRKP
jgi:hypothetical protein